MRAKIDLDIPERFASRQLRKCHRQQLIQAAECVDFVLCDIALPSSKPPSRADAASPAQKTSCPSLIAVSCGKTGHESMSQYRQKIDIVDIKKHPIRIPSGTYITSSTERWDTSEIGTVQSSPRAATERQSDRKRKLKRCLSILYFE
jgi:hypothetical protein